jgi:uncharacterized Zn finger protein
MAVSMTTTGSATASAWWGRRWTKFMQQAGASADAALLRGLRVKRLEVQAGLIQAQVVTRDNGVLGVEVRFPLLTDAQWAAIIDTLGSQALFVAQLLAGNMPAEIEQVFVDAGSWLLPDNAAAIEQRTLTSSGALAAEELAGRALAAVYLQLGEMVAEDPWLLLRLRGRDRQQVLAVLHEKHNTERQASAGQAVPPAESVAAAEAAFYTPPLHTSQTDAGDVLDLADRLADFWGRRKVLEEAHYHLAPPPVELALLRRLGPITANADGDEAYTQLQTIYHRVTRRAWDMAFTPDEELIPDESDTAEES